ncbi:MAG: purine biosynthesis protein PurH [Clostridia bacterium]|nr:purine biosynthesis protein PurH [Clostridia bacterium]
MKSILIKDTTKEERARIVAEAIGNTEGACDGCAPGLERMYDAYIEGKTELREINMAFRGHYVSGAEGPDKSGCGMN